MIDLRRALVPALVLTLLAGLLPAASGTEAESTILLDGDCAFLDGGSVPEYDYVWNADPGHDYGQVKDSPGEYYTGDAPSGDDPVYIAHDIFYYPWQEESEFRQVDYDGEVEWVSFYKAEGYEQYIFSTLPVLRSGFPEWMMHTAEEAYENPVIHITQPGTYRLRGSWQGQIRIDLGEDADTDPSAQVTLILDGADITCTVAPGVLFSQVYECDHAWESREEYSSAVDTSGAGARIVIADGSENRVSGTNIFRILKTKYKDEDDTAEYPAQKKRLKTDGAFYSYMSMSITGEKEGTGNLTIESEFEGLDSELHLTVSGGNIRIIADNDGINVNEDDVSVLTVSGGKLWIQGGMGDEGDGIDSNGYISITGGTVITSGNPAADSGMDADCGVCIDGGTVVSLGSGMDGAKDGMQAALQLRFSQLQSAGDEILVRDPEGNAVFSCIPGFSGGTYSGALISDPALLPGTYSLSIGDRPLCWNDSGSNEGSGIGAGPGTGGFPGAMDAEARQPFPGEDNFTGKFPEEGMGKDGGTPPEGMDRGTPADGQEPFGGQMPPEGMEGIGRGAPPESGMFPGQMDSDQATCGYNTEFLLEEGTNTFSGVSEYRHQMTLQQDGTYICVSCAGVFRDAAGSILVEPDNGSWILRICLGAAAAALAAITVLLIIRKRNR